MSDPIKIMCFTDILCGYAYAGDVRFEELKATFGQQIEISYHFIPVYGDVRRRIARSGKSPDEYGAMALKAARQFEHVTFAEGIFSKVIPASSTAAHLYLRAVKLLQDDGVIEVAGEGQSPFERLTWATRLAFFRDLIDISQRHNLDELAASHDIPVDEVNRVIADGRAYAELSHDLQLQRDHEVKVSPSLVLNEGRQHLNGNVGYRVLEANIRELLRSPEGEMSWC